MDVFERCPSWEAAGMCGADPGYMLLHCRKVIGLTLILPEPEVGIRLRDAMIYSHPL